MIEAFFFFFPPTFSLFSEASPLFVVLLSESIIADERMMIDPRYKKLVVMNLSVSEQCRKVFMWASQLGDRFGCHFTCRSLWLREGFELDLSAFLFMIRELIRKVT